MKCPSASWSAWNHNLQILVKCAKIRQFRNLETEYRVREVHKMDKGRVQVICGEGHGKTAMALGKAVTEVTSGRKVIMIQFLKGVLSTATAEGLKHLEPDLKVFRFEKQQDLFENLTEEQKQEELLNIRNGLNFARKVLTTGECDMLILDEFLGILDQKIISEEELKNFFALREETVDLVLTGKVCPPQLEEYADLVIRIENVKVDK